MQLKANHTMQASYVTNKQTQQKMQLALLENVTEFHALTLQHRFF